jgi:hypothetical protein
MKPLSFNVGQYDTAAAFERDLNLVGFMSPRGLIRLDVVWRYCSDPTGTVFNFTQLDRKIAAIEHRNLRIQLVMPMWCPDKILAGNSEKTQIKTAAALAGFVNFVKAFVTRYGTHASIKGVAIGNEPNLRYPFAPDGADPAWQAKVTNAVAPLLPWKKYSPGMAPASTSNGNMSPYDYLKIYWSALKVSLDGCEIHPYGRASDVSQPWSVLGALTKIHTLVKVPIVASEYNSDANDTDLAKALNVPLGLDYMNGLGFVERVFLYAMSDKPTDGSVRWGMINPTGPPRPLFGAVDKWVAAHT